MEATAAMTTSAPSLSATATATVMRPSTTTAAAAAAAAAATAAATTSTSTSAEQQQPKQRASSNVNHLIAGGLGGMMGTLATFPLEVVKTRLQSSTHMSSMRLAAGLPSSTAASSSLASVLSPTRLVRAFASSTYHHVALIGTSFSVVYREGGIRSLYAGLGPMLAGVMPSRGLQFYFYNMYKSAMTSRLPASWRDSTGAGGIGGSGSTHPLVHMASAAASSITVSTCTCPLWVVKTRMQLQRTVGAERTYRNSFDCFAQIARHEGIRGLYRGLFASYFGVFESTIQFALYEQLKQRRAATYPPGKKPAHPLASVKDFAEYIYMASAAKLVAALLTYPHEVVRTRMREPPEKPGQLPKYHSLRQTVALMYKEDGMMVFYSGLGVHLLRVVPNAAIMFLSVETVLKLLS